MADRKTYALFPQPFDGRAEIVKLLLGNAAVRIAAEIGRLKMGENPFGNQAGKPASFQSMMQLLLRTKRRKPDAAHPDIQL